MPPNRPRFTSQFDFNVYASKIHCGVGDKVGAEVTHDVLINRVVESLPVECSLKWAGSMGNAVELEWEKPGDAVVNKNGGVSKKASFFFTGNVTAPINLICRVANASIFDGGAPRECVVRLNPVETLPGEEEEEETTGLGAGWIIVIILVIIGIAFIIAVACARDNCIMNKLKTLPACAGCLKKLEDMKLISRWGTYKVIWF